MISHHDLRQRCKQYVQDALDKSGMSATEFCKACEIRCTKQLREYISGYCCPTVGRILHMHALTQICPDDYEIPVLRCTGRVEEMRKYIRDGHSQSEFIKASRCDRQVINSLVNGGRVTLLSLIKFGEAWEKYNVPKLINNPDFIAYAARKQPQTRSEKELHWIESAWGALAASARRVRDGLWVWKSDSEYSLELERISDDLYEFRGIFNASGEVSTRREVYIA